MSFSVRGLTDSSVIVPAASERSPSDSLCVHDSGRVIGGDRSSSAGVWAVEFDGPWHFLTSRAPNGATLLKRRHLELLGHALVSVPDWEWYTLRKGSGDREQYLRGSKLEASQGSWSEHCRRSKRRPCGGWTHSKHKMSSCILWPKLATGPETRLLVLS